MAAADAQPASRLDAIRARGVVTCGLPPAMPVFAVVRSSTEAEGFDADFCRALAAAIFGAADRARFVAVATAREFLASPDIDVVFHGLTRTFSREVASGLSFGPVTFYDGQGFAVRAGTGLTAITDLKSGSVCVAAGTPFGPRASDYLAAAGSPLTVREVAPPATAEATFMAGDCVALSADVSTLVALGGNEGGAAFAILPERVWKEPLAPVVRYADRDLLTVLNWTVYAMIDAAERGVTAADIDDGATPWEVLPEAAALGLALDWPARVVGAVGNYEEVYARHFERPSAVVLARDLNAPWNAGGILYAPPLR